MSFTVLPEETPKVAVTVYWEPAQKHWILWDGETSYRLMTTGNGIACTGLHPRQNVGDVEGIGEKVWNPRLRITFP